MSGSVGEAKSTPPSGGDSTASGTDSTNTTYNAAAGASTNSTATNAANGTVRSVPFNESEIILNPLAPTPFGPLLISASTQIGRRKNQEDRFTIAPKLLGGELAFFGVFDGTVQEHASEWVHRNVVRVLHQCPSFIAFAGLTAEQRADRANRKLLTAAMKELYQNVDKELIAFCAAHEYHYSSCTSVTVMLHIPSRTLLVGHIADSHAVVGIPDQNIAGIAGYYLTRPHRPDHPDERKRIEAAGGSLVYLHTNKPFIRGGDFHNRKLAMQLNYSRAFGGKDLKMYGLSAEPDLKLLDIKVPKAPTNASGTEPQGEVVKVLLLGSDGLWDVVNPTDAVVAAQSALNTYTRDKERWVAAGSQGNPPRTPTDALVQLALDNHVQKGSNDNVTCIAVYL